MTAIDFTIEEIAVPDTIDGPAAELFTQYVAVRNTVEAHTVGTDLLAMSLSDAWSEYRDNPHRSRRHFGVWHSGAIIGRGIVTTRPSTPLTGAHLMVDILPAFRRAGLGSALLEVVEQVARDASAPVLKATLPHTVAAGGARIVPTTGSGSLPASDVGAQFLRSNGYVLEQVSRISLLRTRGLGGRIGPLREAAGAVAGNGYRILTWTGATPDDWIDDIAELRTRMSTDAPAGGLVTSVGRWDASRVRAHDARIAASGRVVLTSAAEHASSGTLVGFSELLVSENSTVAAQEDTLVLPDHRGHRLGTLVKVAAADLLLRKSPEVEAIVTYNAEENRPMLDVNEAMGFRAIGYEGSWQKRT